MKRVTFDIFCCTDCPYYDSEDIPICTKMKELIDWEHQTESSFPDFCPLLDAKEEAEK